MTEYNTQAMLRLAYGIVEEAVEEYEFALQRMAVDADYMSGTVKFRVSQKIEELERFFKSDWCYELCGYDGHDIMAQVQRRVVKWAEHKRRKKHVSEHPNKSFNGRS